ncbi:CoA transferase [Sphingopyxis sp.]|jgi:crotonobetainyl-CoA:carnitine CoA-transferase CaiB-like acyl-CoA transferase|uniref:CaiB/BaiF CoA-transferase family protein n=1 Tax=Sphingopyxis sp. TaxID=1908224 RepID=UPI003F707784
MNGPLAGLRVLDCSLGLAGPQASGLLADYGADVIWAEPPGGDPARARHPAAASVFNRNKRSVTLDIGGSAADRARLLRLAARADIMIDSFGPGEAEALGLGFAQLHQDHPHLIRCSITAAGEDPRYRDLAPSEALIHALCATMALQPGHRDGPIFQAIPFASLGAAQLAVIGALAALFRRLDDGVGRHVQTSLLDGALSFHSMFWGEKDVVDPAAATIDTAATRGASRTRMITRSFLCGDGEYIGIHTAAVGAFGRLMAVLGLDDRIAATAGGGDVGTPLTPDEASYIEDNIHNIFASYPRSYWVQRLMEADVCAIEHLQPTRVFDEPQVRNNRMTVQVDDPVLGSVEQVAPAIRFGGEAAPGAPAPAPRSGEHTQALLAALDEPEIISPWRREASFEIDRRPLLDGVRILDLGAFYAGPYSSRLLADLGADVIKVETTAGDQLRGIERPFFSAQAGKRSLSANLKDPRMAPAIGGLIRWADAIHHNMRPGAAERLGLGIDQVRAVNPQALYLYAPGWGSSGPHRLRQSFAPMLSGYVGASLEVAGQYNEPMPSLGNEDPGNGLLGAVALLIGLIERKRTGRVLSSENPQLNAAMGLMAHVVRGPDGEPVGAGRLDVLQMGTDALESLYETADGWICVAASEDRHVIALERLLDMAILTDPMFATFEARLANRDALADRLRAAFERRTTAECLASSSDFMAQPVGADFVTAFLNDPAERVAGRVAEVEDPKKGKVREIAHLLCISDAERAPHRLAPALGEHSDAILLSLGYAKQDIETLRREGVVR